MSILNIHNSKSTQENLSLFQRNEGNVFKSSWKSSFFNRKQIRIRVEPSGKLEIQTIVQKKISQLASRFFKFSSCYPIKSLGKRIVSYEPSTYDLPLNLSVPLSSEIKQLVADLQLNYLSLRFLPINKQLNTLGSQLCDAIPEQELTQEARRFVLEKHQKILDLSLPINQKFVSESSAKEIHELLESFEKEAQEILKSYPQDLIQFLDTQRKIRESRLESVNQDEAASDAKTLHSEAPKIEEPKQSEVHTELIVPVDPPSPIDQDIQGLLTSSIPNEGLKKTPVSADEQPPSATSLPSTDRSEKTLYLNTLEGAKKTIIELISRSQFLAAHWLQKEIETIELMIKGEKEETIRDKREAIENALDCVEENCDAFSQLYSLPKDSPYEKDLMQDVIKEIQNKIKQFVSILNTKELEIKELFKTSKQTEWNQHIPILLLELKEKIEKMNVYDLSESSKWWHFRTQWLTNAHLPQSERQPLESINKEQLIAHYNLIDQFCKNGFIHLEKEIQLERIQKELFNYNALSAQIQTKIKELKEALQYVQANHLKNLQKNLHKSIASLSSSLENNQNMVSYANSLQNANQILEKTFNEIDNQTHKIDPIKQLHELQSLSQEDYTTLHQILMEEGLKELKRYINTLEHYHELLNAYLTTHSSENEALLSKMEMLDKKILNKINQAKSFYTHYVTRLHFWEIFCNEVPINQLPPHKLDEYLTAITTLKRQGIEEINFDLQKEGFTFNPSN